jgi:hypothetical protein
MLSKDHPEKQRHLLHGRREDFASRRIELTLAEEVIEDSSVFRSEELLEPDQFRYLLFDYDAPWQYRSHHHIYPHNQGSQVDKTGKGWERNYRAR